MSEPIITPEGGNTTPERSFSQEDVNRIVSERLTKDRAKAEADFTRREQELAQREFTYAAREYLMAKKIPPEVLGALNATDMPSLEKAIALLDAHTSILHHNPNPLNIPPSGDLPPMGDDYDVRQAFGLQRRNE